MKTIPVEAVAALFLRRQHLDQPLKRPFTQEALTRFAEDAGGLQLDSINVVERAHYLTVWSRFGPYDKAALDRIVYEKRALVEYWAHAACLVAASDLSGWRRAMADFRRRHTGWPNWRKAHPRVLRHVENEIRCRGPLSAGAFARPSSQGGPKAGGTGNRRIMPSSSSGSADGWQSTLAGTSRRAMTWPSASCLRWSLSIGPLFPCGTCARRCARWVPKRSATFSSTPHSIGLTKPSGGGEEQSAPGKERPLRSRRTRGLGHLRE